MKSGKEMVVGPAEQQGATADYGGSKKVSPGASIRNFDSGPAVPSRDWRYHQHIDPNLKEPDR
ncbi:hypothetical protein [Pseudomonas sp. B21-048]|uniref:hypothetical protein n=1 Tax=Pseudomonas sp. B21-048 TaxID=2895490 RepID=UPI00216095B9|nr:hypothetical protein [Pseudomonas sp. B21-048]UVK96485.1 hypothetical protein LOY56_13730 [Pseudomonas sp. B21-048]